MKLSGAKPEPPDFSLVLGGPLYQILRRTHLSGNSLELHKRRIIVSALVTWLPLFILALLGGQLLGGPAAVPFLKDFEVHARFLVAVPLLIVAEIVIHDRLRFVVRQFVDRKLIPDSARAQFDAAIASAFRLRNSVAAEVLQIALVYGVFVFIVWRRFILLQTTTWYTAPSETGPTLTFAGIWYGYVSLAIFQFLLLRWYFRLLVWMRFLWQVSRIELNLIPTHPDRLGGLGFLANTAHALMPLAMAHGAVVAGYIANRIFHLGAELPHFVFELAAAVLLMQCLAFVPLFVFAAQLARTKRKGLREYGTLAARYVGEFDDKWLRGGVAAKEPLVGSADIQSLADLDASFEVVRGIRILPITRDTVLMLAAATLLPVAPLLLTMMPLEELVRKLVGILF